MVPIKEDGKHTEFTLTPTINNLTNDQHLSNETNEGTIETELDYAAFGDNLDTASHGTLDSLDTHNNIPAGQTNNSFKTATGDLYKTNRKLQNLQMENVIKEMVATILNDAKATTIRNAIQQEIARALHDEELDIQQSQTSITLGKQITMATSMEKLLLKWMEKTKTEYKLLKQQRQSGSGNHPPIRLTCTNQRRQTTNLGEALATCHCHGQGTQNSL
jgi:hypothetical protein